MRDEELTSRADVAAWLRDGHFGPLRVGAPFADVERWLGAPEDWGPERARERAGIHRYGTVEFHRDGSALTLIHSDTAPLLHGVPRADSAQRWPWFKAPLETVREQLATAGLSLLEIASPSPDARWFRSPGGVTLIFERGGNGPSRLTTLSHSLPR